MKANHRLLCRIFSAAAALTLVFMTIIPASVLAEAENPAFVYEIMEDEHGEKYAAITGVNSDISGVREIEIYSICNDGKEQYPIREIGAGVFKDCTALESLVITSNLTTIGDSAFQGCTALNSITVSGVNADKKSAALVIPASVKSVGAHAFDGCAALTEVTVSDGVSYLGINAFANCPSLTAISLPNSLEASDTKESIGEGLLSGSPLAVIKAHSDSYACEYATKNAIPFEKVSYTVMETIANINDVINGFVWGPIMLVVFLFVGLLCTVRSRFFQVSKFKLWMDETILAIFKKKSVRKTQDKKAISQFQALSTALAATVGTGNIAGVATAIVSGGPGAIFWMWLSAFLGMMTNFSENVLGIKYRYKNKKGEWVGGAMIYMDRGLHMKWLAVIFSCFCILASFGIGNLSQANSIAQAVNTTFTFIPTWVVGILIMIVAALVIIGGIKRIAKVTEKIVPFMAIFYILGGLIVILININKVPAAFGMIFKSAFNMKAAGGGILGFTVAQAMRYGIARGVFSNEAGLGSSVMVHSASDVKEPVVQGMWGIFEVFADTIVICTITALSILTTVYDPVKLGPVDAAGAEISGAALTTAAFNSVLGPIGGIFISISLTMFAFSTILGWSYYGERGIEYVFGLKAVPIYKVIFICVIFFGCIGNLSFVWNISDTFNGLMAIPNLFAVILLHGQVMQEIKDYNKRRKEGKLLQ